jgi:hypothetical protein
MRSKPLFIAAVIAALLTSNALAQQTTRIKFRRGAIHADVSGTLNSFRSKRVFVIKVRDGQTLRTEQFGSASRRITIFVKDATGNDVGDADASCNDRKEVSPTVAGDYTIEVVECQKADPWRGRFTFRVTVR